MNIGGRLLLESEDTEIGIVVREILGEDRLGRLFRYHGRRV